MPRPSNWTRASGPLRSTGLASASIWAASGRATPWTAGRRFCVAAGFSDFLIQAGGDLYAAGRHGDRPWRVGLFDPRGKDGETFATIDLADETFSTSGDYERFFIKDSVRYHHILDPQTGQPARLCRSVTILARDALTADWASTGRLHHGTGSRHVPGRIPPRRGSRDRHRRERGQGLERVEGSVESGESADAVAGAECRVQSAECRVRCRVRGAGAGCGVPRPECCAGCSAGVQRQECGGRASDAATS